MLYHSLRPSVENLSMFMIALGRHSQGDRGSEWELSAFETLSNILEHNFYGKKIPHLSTSQLKRESIKHYKHKILITLRIKNALHSSCMPKTFAMRCIFTPILPPTIPTKSQVQNRAKLLQVPRYKLCFLQNGRGMRIIYRFCSIRLAKITSTKYCIMLKGHINDYLKSPHRRG